MNMLQLEIRANRFWKLGQPTGKRGYTYSILVIILTIWQI